MSDDEVQPPPHLQVNPERVDIVRPVHQGDPWKQITGDHQMVVKGIPTE